MLVRSLIYGWGFDFMRPFQKRSSFCLPKVASFFIHCESNGISSRFSVYIITVGAYHQPQAVYSFAMMISSPTADDIPQQVADDIQGFHLDLFAEV